MMIYQIYLKTAMLSAGRSNRFSKSIANIITMVWNLTYHSLVYRHVLLEVTLVVVFRCQGVRSFLRLLLDILPPHPIHDEVFSRFRKVPGNRRRRVFPAADRFSESRVSSHYSRRVTFDSSRKKGNEERFRHEKHELVSYRSSATLRFTRKLRQRPRLTFARNVRSPPAGRPNIALTRRTRSTLLKIAAERDAIDSALLSASRFARAPRGAALSRGNAEKQPTRGNCRHSGLHSRVSRTRLELSRRLYELVDSRTAWTSGLERNLGRPPRTLPACELDVSATASSSTLVNVSSWTSATRHSREAKCCRKDGVEID